MARQINTIASIFTALIVSTGSIHSASAQDCPRGDLDKAYCVSHLSSGVHSVAVPDHYGMDAFVGLMRKTGADDRQVSLDRFAEGGQRLRRARLVKPERHRPGTGQRPGYPRVGHAGQFCRAWCQWPAAMGSNRPFHTASSSALRYW